MIEAAAEGDDALTDQVPGRQGADRRRDQARPQGARAQERDRAVHVRHGVQEQGRAGAARCGHRVHAVADGNAAHQGPRRRRRTRHAPGARRCAVRGAGVQDPERPVRRQPDVLPRLFRRAQVRRHRVRAHQAQARAHRPPAADACQRAHRHQGSPRRRHRLGRGPQGRHHRRHAVRRGQDHHAREDDHPDSRDRGGGGAQDQGRPGKDGRGAAAPGQGRPVVPRQHRRGVRPDHHLRHGRAAPGNHRRPHEARVQGGGQCRQAAGGLPRDHPRQDRVRRQARQAVRRPRPVRARVAEARAQRDRQGQRVRQRHRRRHACRASSSRPSRRA